MADIERQAQQYYQLVQEGMSPRDAYAQAFPNGIPTAQDRAKVAAKARQNSQYAQIGGTLAGALATKYLVDNVPGWLSSEVGKEVAEETVKVIANQGGAVPSAPPSSGTPSAAPSPETPNIVAANKATAVGTTTMPDGTKGTLMSDGSMIGESGKGITSDGATIDVAPYLQAGLSVLSAYQAYKSYKEGDNIGAGLAGASAVAGGVAAAGGAGSATASAAAWPLAIITTAYNSYKNYDKAKENAGNSSLTEKEVGTVYDPYGGAARKYLPQEIIDPAQKILGTGLAATIAKKTLGSGKDDDQIYRDRWRNRLEERGLATKNEQGSHQIQLADGSYFDVGRDGDNKQEGKDLAYYDIDFDNPNFNSNAEDPNSDAQLIGKLNVLSALTTGGSKELKEHATGYLYNAVKSSGDPNANLQKLFSDSGLTKDNALAGIVNLKEAGRISDEEFAAYQNGINDIYGSDGGLVAPAAAVQAPQQGSDIQSNQQEQEMSNYVNPTASLSPEQLQQMQIDGVTPLSQGSTPNIGTDPGYGNTIPTKYDPNNPIFQKPNTTNGYDMSGMEQQPGYTNTMWTPEMSGTLSPQFQGAIDGMQGQNIQMPQMENMPQAPQHNPSSHQLNGWSVGEGGQLQGAPTTMEPMQPQGQLVQAVAEAIKRSSTRSPGIDMNGKRISY